MVRRRGKTVAHLLQRHLQAWAAALLQPRKWQLIRTGCSTAAQGTRLLIARGHGRWTRSYAASRHSTPQSTALGLQPVICVPNYVDYYLFTDPWGMDDWVGHVGWPIADGLTTKWSPAQLAVWYRIWKVRRPRPTFYPLCYAAYNDILQGNHIRWKVTFYNGHHAPDPMDGARGGGQNL